jgi:23S rRNA (pseudouridine1915-N3)-methyltransferase
VVLLDAAGRTFTSEKFAGWLREARDGGVRELVFLCGGAEGFPEAWRRRAGMKLSLSSLTFSHELARAMLAEQLYRAFTILSGHPYAK